MVGILFWGVNSVPDFYKGSQVVKNITEYKKAQAQPSSCHHLLHMVVTMNNTSIDEGNTLYAFTSFEAF